MFDLVKELSELPGPTGHEDPVQDWLVERWSRFASDVRRTRVNNVLARIAGSGPRLAIVGHADEICLMVKSVSDCGFLHLWPYYSDQLGKPPRWFTPLNQPALVVASAGNVPGVFATASGHVVGGRNRQKDQFEWNDWFVDIGARSRDEVEAQGIGPGARVIWNPQTRRIGHNITGKAMDDRAALAIATAVGERLAGRDDLPYEVWLASTVQEENGLLGAASLADEQPFDCAIALDVGLTGDIPGPDERDFPAKLGVRPDRGLPGRERPLFATAVRSARRRRQGRKHPDSNRNLPKLRQRWRRTHPPRRGDGAADLPNPVHPFPYRNRRRGRSGEHRGSARRVHHVRAGTEGGASMSAGANSHTKSDRDDLHFRDMLLRVRAVDPAADADAVRRYAREIAEADAMLQALDLDPSSAPLDVSFSPDWNHGRTT